MPSKDPNKWLNWARANEARYRLSLHTKPKKARGYWNLAYEAYQELAKLGWKPTRGCLWWHHED